VDAQDVMQAAHIEHLLDRGAERADGEFALAALGGTGGLENRAESGARDVVERTEIGGDLGIRLDGVLERSFQSVGAFAIGAAGDAENLPAGSDFLCYLDHKIVSSMLRRFHSPQR
jgi:hypothetical protein